MEGLCRSAHRGDIFERPEFLFVARHMGQPSINELDCTLEQEGGEIVVRSNSNGLDFAVAPQHAARLQTNQKVTLGIRPQHLSVHPLAENPDASGLPARVVLFEALGAYGVLIVSVGDEKNSQLELTALTSLDVSFERGEPVILQPETAKFHYFDAESGRNLLSTKLAQS